MPYYAQPSSSRTNQAAFAGASGYGGYGQQQLAGAGQQGYQYGNLQGGQQLGGQQFAAGQYTQEQVQQYQLQQQYAAAQGNQKAQSQEQYAQQYAPQQLGTGYGAKYLAPAEIQAQLAGKPAFYDNIRGIYFDGARAWYYDSTGAPGARNSWSSASVATAVEQQAPTAAAIRLGNGTEGNIAELRAHPTSVYYGSPY